MNHAMNLALDAVNTMLAASGYEQFTAEQVACLNDVNRHTEAWDMLDDIESRVVPVPELRPLFRALAMRFGDALYAKEFPSYGALGFDIPEGFEDQSWHNDVCPSFVGKGYTLWANWADKEHREFDVERYALCIHDDHPDITPAGPLHHELVLSAENSAEVLSFIAATEKYSAEQRVFIGQRITRIKAEVLHAVAYCEPLAGKIVPITITSFGDLHDYCDANELGGLCDDDITAKGSGLFPERTDNGTLATQAWMDACDVIQDTIHDWIASGSMRVAALAMKGYTTTETKEEEHA